MKTVINDQVLLEETLHTVFVKAEAIVNNRLLTAVSDDVNNYWHLLQTTTSSNEHQIIAHSVSLKKVK